MKHWYGADVPLGFWLKDYALDDKSSNSGKGLLLIESQLAERKLSVYIKEEACKRIHEYLQAAYDNPPAYNLFSFNCIGLVKEVAKRAGVGEIGDIGGAEGIATPGELSDAIDQMKSRGVPAEPYPR